MPDVQTDCPTCLTGNSLPAALTREQLPIGTVALARYLIGKALISEHPDGITFGRIVETEAYPPDDSSGHAFRGCTPRNRSLFLEHGHAYVYIAYGLSNMLNVSSEVTGVGAGVLLRALEPLGGIALMLSRCHKTRRSDLARGPGRLAMAMGINRRFDGVDLCAEGKLWLAAAPLTTGSIGSSVRIGITREVDRPLRFYERGSAQVSGPKRLRS